MNTFLLLALIFFVTLGLGKLLEKIRVPWVFGALLLGLVLAIQNPFEAITTSETFSFLAQMGMYMLLFLVGLELDSEKLRAKKKFILGSTVGIILFEAVLGTLFIHFVFHYAWIVSLLVALSFATVGEAILIPILDEFKLLNSSLGQAIIGIGTADDIVEVIALILVSILVGADSAVHIGIVFGALMVLFILLTGLIVLRKEGKQFRFKGVETLFLFLIAVFFLFMGVGTFADAMPLAALLAGVGLRLFLPRERLQVMEQEIKTMTYGFFAPIFFVWVGSELDMNYLWSYPLLILLVILISNGAKMVASYVAGRKELGNKGSVLLGIGLSVRFSTSIIIIKFLFDKGVVGADIFSVIVASSILLQFIIPILFSRLLVRWGYVEEKK